MNETKSTKIQIFNVVILDKSGSMECIRKAAISGFNETLVGIKKAQEQFADTQVHYLSLVTFCECETTYVFDKVPIVEARPLTQDDYQPCCRTPLYDAMGFVLTTMRKHVTALEDAVVVVTIITDGLENASKEFTGVAIKGLVEQLKSEGWTFTYMGANQDSTEIAFNLSIRNSRNFDYSARGTVRCMAQDTDTRMNFFSRLADFKENVDYCEVMPVDERRVRYMAMADEAFDEEESKNPNL